jgi:GPH family glycoside/pentoside/hexuronide:cation symporter
MGGPRSPKARPFAALALFAAGDFAFNLYWQSLMLYMLFYYTEALHLPIETAANGYLVASVWDGVASLGVGLLVDRFAGTRSLRWALVIGAGPLGLAFIAAYSPPPFPGLGLAAWVVAAQIGLRTVYALVNIPYLALSARISALSEDRATVAGLRMLAGTLAAVAVAFGTHPLGRALGGVDDAQAYRRAAMLFALAASLVLVVVGLSYREGAPPPPRLEGSVRKTLIGAFGNRAFTTLLAAMTAMIIAVTVLDRSVLYYFKFILNDQAAGSLTLAWMAAISGVVLPAWMAAARTAGVRWVWFLAIGLGVTGLVSFVLFDLRTTLWTQGFLIFMQGVVVGLNFAVWAMVPDTIEYGEARTGVRVEAALYGYVALFQRIAIGLGAVLLGASLKRAGLSSTLTVRAADPWMFRATLALIPLVFLILSGVMMAFNPLRRVRQENPAA